MHIERQGKLSIARLPKGENVDKSVNLKGFVFQNFYTTGPQIGIQSAHSIAKLCIHYGYKPAVEQWALHDQTLVVLNGGDHDELYRLKILLQAAERNAREDLDKEQLFYFSHFKEPGLNNSFTNVAVVPSIPCMKVIEALQRRKNCKWEMYNFNDYSSEDVWCIGRWRRDRGSSSDLFDSEIAKLTKYEAEIILKIVNGRTLK